MTNDQETNQKEYDFEKRTLDFSKRIIYLCKALPKNSANDCFSSQSIRSGTSIGANYREANDALGKKDFILHLKIARKEAKETIYWLLLIAEANSELSSRMQNIITEANELKNILSSMIINAQNNN